MHGNHSHTPEGKSLVFEAGEGDFPERVLALSYQRPVLVDFWAEWCPPCIALAPVLERLAREYVATVSLAKVEVDAGDNMRLAGHYRLRGFPTVLLFWHGEPIARFSGARPYHWVEGFVREHLPAISDEG